MAINWRQRAPILRVLAAVYADLGGDAVSFDPLHSPRPAI